MIAGIKRESEKKQVSAGEGRGRGVTLPPGLGRRRKDREGGKVGGEGYLVS